MYRFRAQRGFTLVEALVAVLVGVIALLGLYALVDASNKLTKQQTELADVQQSGRIGVSELSRVIRQSRVGSLYFGNAVLPIANNISGGTFYTDTSTPTPQKHYIRQGTDVIEVRGVISGDKYILDEGNAPGSCCSAPINVTIPATAALGYVNFDSTHPPSLAAKTKSFYFVVVNGQNQQVTVGGGGLTYLVPVYVVGLVDTTANPHPCSINNPTWCTLTLTTLTFWMNPEDAGARKLNASATLPPSLTSSITGGAIDVVRFFVDEGSSPAADPPTLDTHPSLAEATLDASTGSGPETAQRWDIQPLVEEVEDFQIAYGVDAINGPAPPCAPTEFKCHDGGVSPAMVNLGLADSDEWVGNFTDEADALVTQYNSSADPKHVDAFIDTSVPSGQPAVPALHSVWISLVVKSTSPDFVYDGPGARGINLLDSTALSFSAPTATGRPYRRRPLSLAVSLRNNGLYQPAPTPTP